jgi:hypothetical protein
MDSEEEQPWSSDIPSPPSTPPPPENQSKRPALSEMHGPSNSKKSRPSQNPFDFASKNFLSPEEPKNSTEHRLFRGKATNVTDFATFEYGMERDSTPNGPERDIVDQRELDRLIQSIPLEDRATGVMDSDETIAVFQC